jgi:CBS domain-containing protein
MLDAGELCNREVVVAEPNEPLLEAARRMRDEHVGSLVVVEGPPDRRVPVGIITDRDIVIYAVAIGGGIPDRTVDSCMTQELVTARERDGLAEVIHLMRTNGVRRLPIVDEAGVLQGILTLDDVLELLAEQVQEIAALFPRERRREAAP